MSLVNPPGGNLTGFGIRSHSRLLALLVDEHHRTHQCKDSYTKCPTVRGIHRISTYNREMKGELEGHEDLLMKWSPKRVAISSWGQPAREQWTLDDSDLGREVGCSQYRS